jgi:hypothetical protein
MRRLVIYVTIALAACTRAPRTTFVGYIGALPAMTATESRLTTPAAFIWRAIRIQQIFQD